MNKQARMLLDPKNLPYFGAIVQAVMFGVAGSVFFPNPYFGAIVGLGVGAVVNWSIALASSRITTIAEGRKRLANIALIGMLALSPTTITLSMFYPTQIYTAIAWAIDVDLSIVLAGAIVGKSLIADGEQKKKPAKNSQSETSGVAQGRSAKTAKGKAKGAESPTIVACRYAGAGCGRNGSQNAMNAHANHCQFKPMAIDQSLLLHNKTEK